MFGARRDDGVVPKRVFDTVELPGLRQHEGDVVQDRGVVYHLHVHAHVSPAQRTFEAAIDAGGTDFCDQPLCATADADLMSTR